MSFLRSREVVSFNHLTRQLSSFISTKKYKQTSICVFLSTARFEFSNSVYSFHPCTSLKNVENINHSQMKVCKYFMLIFSLDQQIVFLWTVLSSTFLASQWETYILGICIYLNLFYYSVIFHNTKPQKKTMCFWQTAFIFWFHGGHHNIQIYNTKMKGLLFQNVFTYSTSSNLH